jgi:hypothetical protein
MAAAVPPPTSRLYESTPLRAGDVLARPSRELKFATAVTGQAPSVKLSETPTLSPVTTSHPPVTAVTPHSPPAIPIVPRIVRRTVVGAEGSRARSGLLPWLVGGFVALASVGAFAKAGLPELALKSAWETVPVLASGTAALDTALERTWSNRSEPPPAPSPSVAAAPLKPPPAHAPPHAAAAAAPRPHASPPAKPKHAAPSRHAPKPSRSAHG